VPSVEIDRSRGEVAVVTLNRPERMNALSVGLATNLDAPSLRHAIELENHQQVLGTFTGNMLEAMHAFQQKRSPRWKPL
jgi:enoyl-CoA hydratase/carnithine racemase